MIKLGDLFGFVENNFDYLLVVTEARRVAYASPLLRRICKPDQLELEGEPVEALLTRDSLESIRHAMAQVAQGKRSVALFAPRREPELSAPLKAECVNAAQGRLFLFYGTHLDSIGRVSDWEKDERIKELSCLYAVAEWLRAAEAEAELFARLPEIIARGMQFPAQTVVTSRLGSTRFGHERPAHERLSTRLVVNGEPVGEIEVGYLSEEYALLPEEQKMLHQIGRMISLTLEQRQLSQRLLLKQAEEQETAQRLRELEREIAARAAELGEQRAKLTAVDACLSQVMRDKEESTARLKTLFEAIPDRVALIDARREVVMTNRAEIEPGRKCHQVFYDRGSVCEDCRFDKVVQQKAPVTAVIKQGERYLQVQATPVFDRLQRVSGIVEFYRDITLEKTYEQQIQRADKMAALGQLVSGIGHEINNPNQFIRGNVRIVREALEDMLPILDGYHRYHPELKIARLKYEFFRSHILTLVEDMGHGSERIKQIVDALRGFVRHDDGLLLDRVELNTLVEATARLVDNEVHKHATVRLELADGIPTFLGNSQKIEQVLVNLLMNASQAMDEQKGNILVRTSREAGSVVLQVQDDGRGMSDKTMQQIFDPFFTTKRAQGGTGLGLAISYRIIAEHGGSVSVTSAPGRGSTFTIKFPIDGERLGLSGAGAVAGERRAARENRPHSR